VSAAAIRWPGRLAIEDLDRPAPAPGAVLVQQRLRLEDHWSAWSHLRTAVDWGVVLSEQVM
jgi:hypothetical protein